MKKKITLISIIALLAIAIVTLVIILVLNGGKKTIDTESAELKKAKETFDIRLNTTGDEYYIFGVKPLAKINDYTLSIPDSVDAIPVTEIHDAIDFARYQELDIRIVRLGKNIRYIIGNVKGNDDINNPYGENIFQSANSLVRIEVSEENQTFASVDGILFSKDLKTLIKYPSAKSAWLNEATHRFDVPSTVTRLYPHAFYNHRTLESITIGASVERIGKEALANCAKLSYVKFDGNVSIIETRAFANDISLVSISLPEGITSLSRGLFSKCSNLKSLYLPDSLCETGDFFDDVFIGCTSFAKLDTNQIPTARVYVSEVYVEKVKEIIAKYPMFSDFTNDQLSRLVVKK